MLAVVVLAGLLPNTGVVSASSNCTYGKCPAAAPFPIWAVSAAALVAVLALIVALLLLRRGRRPPSGTAPAEGGAAAGTVGPEDQPTSPEGWNETTDAPEAPSDAGQGAVPYDEGSYGPSP
jgi:hypothetical protein